MALQYSTAVRNKMLDAIEGHIASVILGAQDFNLVIYSGSVPASASAALGGAVALVTKLITSNGFTNYMTTASGGVCTTAGTYPLTMTIATAGTMSFWRLVDGAGNSFVQGTIGVGGSGADLIVESTTALVGQQLKIDTLNFTASNA